MRTNNSVGLGLRQQADNTAGGGRTAFHIIASYNMSMLESYSNRALHHKNYQILDPQSQVAIFNREELVSNIRDNNDNYTLKSVTHNVVICQQIHRSQASYEFLLIIKIDDSDFLG